MFDIKNFVSAIAQIAEEKGISSQKVMETIEMAIAAAYKKDYGKKGQIIKAKLDPESGAVSFKLIKLVVDEKMIYSEEELEEMKEKFSPGRSLEERELSSAELAEGKKVRFNPERHILLEEAKKTDAKLKVGDEIEISLEEKEDYGRIAAQTAKQVILQRIREAEKESVFDEYKSKEGEIVSGVVQRIEGRNIFLDLGKTLGILPREEQTPGEFYRPGQRLKLFLLKVDETPKGPAIILSRAYPKLISKLFELEVPEVSAGQVQIMAIAREAGSRSKIAVSAEAEGIDPIGSMVGQRGTRVMAVINELAGEKVDIIEYSPDPEKYIANALLPAKAINIIILPKNKSQAIVPEDQLSLAIGKDGQNVRLAAKLTGWKIDVKPPAEEGAAEEDNNEEADKKEAETVAKEEKPDTEENKKVSKKEKKEAKKPAKKKSKAKAEK
jgi:N utilization substance protein A